jgi:hypothetical protein
MTANELDNLIPLKHNLLADKKYADALSIIVGRIRGLPSYMNYRADMECLLLICSMIEHIVTKGDGTNKQELCLECLNNIFNLTPTEIETSKNSIEFLMNHNRIKKLNTFYVMIKTCLAFFKKKLG